MYLTIIDGEGYCRWLVCIERISSDQWGSGGSGGSLIRPSGSGLAGDAAAVKASPVATSGQELT
jgi:hypothetical protein